MAVLQTFERYEKKYLLDHDQEARQIRFDQIEKLVLPACQSVRIKTEKIIKENEKRDNQYQSHHVRLK